MVFGLRNNSAMDSLGDGAKGVPIQAFQGADDDAPAGDVIVWLAAIDVQLLDDLARRFSPRRVNVNLTVRPAASAVDALAENVRFAVASTTEEILHRLLFVDAIAVFVDARLADSESVDEAMRYLAFPIAEGGTYTAMSSETSLLGGELLERATVEAEVAAMPHQPPETLEPDGDEVRLALEPMRDAVVGVVAVHTFRKRMSHLRKLRHIDPHRVLDRRVGRGRWGELIDSQAALTFQSRARVHHNREAEHERYAGELDVPQMNLVRYDFAECWPRQLARVGRAAVPETFRHFTGGHLHNVFLHWASQQYGRQPLNIATDVLEGRYFFLTSEFPHHFGHVMTEVLTRFWGWWELKADLPDLKALVGVEETGAELRPFVRSLLNAAGIVDSDIVTVDGPVVVEHLYAATPQFSAPRFAHPALEETWSRVGSALRDGAGQEGEIPEAGRLFVGRSSDLKRTCHNSDDVERAFVERGFTVVRPEKMSIADQAKVFWQASVVAGYGGSAMC
ncbi:MAG: glycosyltransferase 61 family protein, partial [Acidimicrobiales bacterium]|nr:glycosyltransferase 61 family protein [Acidimicrobiales bacterium]